MYVHSQIALEREAQWLTLYNVIERVFANQWIKAYGYRVLPGEVISYFLKLFDSLKR